MQIRIILKYLLLIFIVILNCIIRELPSPPNFTFVEFTKPIKEEEAMLDNTGCAGGRPSRCMALRGRLVLSVRCMLLALLLAGGATAATATETAKRVITLGGDVTEIVYQSGRAAASGRA